MEDVECLQPQRKRKTLGESRDEIEALKAIYNNNEEEEEVKEDEKKVVVISREDFGKENESFTSSEKREEDCGDVLTHKSNDFDLRWQLVSFAKSVLDRCVKNAG